MFARLEPLTPLLEEIRRCIPAEDEISDDASPALHSVRRTIRNINDKIHGAMNNLLNSSTTRSYLQDAVITMRNGRYCLPVKAEYKGQVPGMIHDQSSTGSTLFIEPMSVVKLNNDLKEAFLKEQEAIEAVLAELSNLTAQYAAYLLDNYRILADLDFILQKQTWQKSRTVWHRFLIQKDASASGRDVTHFWIPKKSFPSMCIWEIPSTC